MRGHLFPSVAILEQLRERGHRIAVRALAGEVEMLRGLGFEAEPLSPPVEALAMDDWLARTPIGAARRATGVFARRAARDGPDLSRALREVRPDALLVDAASWGALGAAEAWGGPWASICPLPLPVPSRDAPPFGPGLPPARRLPGRLRDGLGWALVERSFDRLVLADLNQVRSGLGATPLDHAHELFERPPLMLCTTAEAFEHPRSDWPANVAFVGPCAWDPPGPTGSPAGIEDGAPLVLATASTEFRDGDRLVRVVLEALAGEPCQVVATCPTSTVTDLELPANATVAPFLPHRPLLARAACAITHGGMGATQKALAAGVPVCAVPFGRDQFEVARRLVESGAGTQLHPWRLTSKRLRGKVREATAKRPAAERLASAYAATGGVTTAADAFERLWV